MRFVIPRNCCQAGDSVTTVAGLAADNCEIYGSDTVTRTAITGGGWYQAGQKLQVVFFSVLRVEALPEG
ncbi:hypothetical protein BaRGS_00000355, partial [Batillaria attramentaria]